MSSLISTSTTPTFEQLCRQADVSPRCIRERYARHSDNLLSNVRYTQFSLFIARAFSPVQLSEVILEPPMPISMVTGRATS